MPTGNQNSFTPNRSWLQILLAIIALVSALGVAYLTNRNKIPETEKAYPASTNTVHFSGIVFDTLNNPIKDAKIQIIGKGNFLTDDNGSFNEDIILDSKENYQIRINVTHPDFKPDDELVFLPINNKIIIMHKK